MYFFKNLEGLIEALPYKHHARVADGELAPYKGKALIVGHFQHPNRTDVWAAGEWEVEEGWKYLKNLSGGGTAYKLLAIDALPQYADEKGFSIVSSQRFNKLPKNSKQLIYHPKERIPMISPRGQETPQKLVKEEKTVELPKPPKKGEMSQVFID